MMLNLYLGTMRLVTFLFLIFFSCSSPKEKIPDVPLMQSKAKKTVIYQLMVPAVWKSETVNKLHGTLEENGVGKFNDINDAALKGIKELGVSHVWYTGVLEHATLTDYTQFGIPNDDADVVKGRAGRPMPSKITMM